MTSTDNEGEEENTHQLQYRNGKLAEQIVFLNRQLDLVTEKKRELEAALKPNLFKTADQLPPVTTETETNQPKPLDYELELFLDRNLFNIFFQHRPKMYEASIFKLKVRNGKIMDVSYKD